MRIILIALLASLAASCSSFSHVSMPDRTDVLSPFQVIQNGRLLEPANGVVTLTRNSFIIQYKGNALRPSVFASTSQLVEEQYRQLREPLVTWSGTGTAAYSAQLYATGKELEIFEGWSQSFDKKWGIVLGKENRSSYDFLRKRLSAEPLLLASGRNYTNFVPQQDGSHNYTVLRINDKAISETQYKRLYLVLFMDNFSPGRGATLYELHWVPLVLEFADD